MAWALPSFPCWPTFRREWPCARPPRWVVQVEATEAPAPPGVQRHSFCHSSSGLRGWAHVAFPSPGPVSRPRWGLEGGGSHVTPAWTFPPTPRRGLRAGETPGAGKAQPQAQCPGARTQRGTSAPGQSGPCSPMASPLTPRGIAICPGRGQAHRGGTSISALTLEQWGGARAPPHTQSAPSGPPDEAGHSFRLGWGLPLFGATEGKGRAAACGSLCPWF